MSTIRLHQITSSTPEEYLRRLIDFGPARSAVFGNSADAYLKVHAQSRSHAEVTEGSSGIWERLDYDWSAPNHIVLKTMDSNVWSDASGHVYDFTRRSDGMTEIDVTVVREGKNLRGRLLGIVLGSIGRRVLDRAFESSVRVVEHRECAVFEHGSLL